MESLSIDDQVNYAGEQLVHGNGDLKVPAFAVANVGARYPIKVGHQNAVVRVLVSNVFNTSGWQTSPSQVIDRTTPRALRITLSLGD